MKYKVIIVQELNDSTLKTDEVHMDVYIEGGTNTTVRCDFGEDTSSVITVEVHHSPYDAPVVNMYVETCVC